MHMWFPGLSNFSDWLKKECSEFVKYQIHYNEGGGFLETRNFNQNSTSPANTGFAYLHSVINDMQSELAWLAA